MLTKRFKIFFIFFSFVFLFTLFCLLDLEKAEALTIKQLNEQILQERKETEALNKQIKEYQEKIKEKQKQEKSLENQISIMNTEIKKAEIEIQAKEKEIEEKELQIKVLEMKIEEKEKEVLHQKEILAALIRNLYEYDQKTTLEILLLSSSLSEYLDGSQYIRTIYQETREKLDKIKDLKKNLEWQKKEIFSQKTLLLTLKLELNVKKRDLENQRKGKEGLLFVTKEEEKNFRKLLAQAEENRRDKEREITRLQEEIRKILIRMQGEYKGDFVWPLSGRITQYFGQTPFSQTGIYGRDSNGNPLPHSGIDLANYNGAPIVSATDGEVIQAGCSPISGCNRGYGKYVAVLSKDLWLIYGHLNLDKPLGVAKGDVIKKGTLLGYQGNSGRSFGSHLHFEIRKRIDKTDEKGKKYSYFQLVNPLNYLP